jgi:hypothetical protein
LEISITLLCIWVGGATEKKPSKIAASPLGMLPINK